MNSHRHQRYEREKLSIVDVFINSTHSTYTNNTSTNSTINHTDPPNLSLISTTAFPQNDTTTRPPTDHPTP